MTSEDDHELKELVIQALEKDGSLGRIKAQLREAVFSILDESLEKSTPTLPDKPSLELDCKNGCGNIMISLIHEFLKFYNLKCTQHVFEPELPVNSTVLSREQLCRILNIDEAAVGDRPLLETVIKKVCQDVPQTGTDIPSS